MEDVGCITSFKHLNQEDNGEQDLPNSTLINYKLKIKEGRYYWFIRRNQTVKVILH